MVKLILNRQGFALALILALLPVLVGGFFAASLSIGLIQSDLKLKHICRSEGLLSQEKVGHHLEKLFALNPRAAHLKLQLHSARIAFAAAVAAQNPLSAARLAQQISQIREKQTRLDFRQKQLINESNRELLLSSQRIRKRLQADGSKILEGFPGLRVSFQTGVAKPPHLAVSPDSLDIAPIYRPQESFEQMQTLAHNWHYQIELLRPFSSFFRGRMRFEKSCSVTLSQKGFKWVPKIAKGKSLSKSAW